jgi:hypothetical protein
MTSALSAYEQWMVTSNLKTIRETRVTAAEQAAILRANGYSRIADAIEIETAKAEIRRTVMARFGGHFGGALTGVEVSDDDARRYIGGATIDELLEAS